MRLIAEIAASLALVALFCSPPCGAGGQSIEYSPSEPVPAEDYPLYDAVVAKKFLTSETRLVLLDRLTLVRLHPEEEGPVRMEHFQLHEIFDNRLPAELISDFTAKNQTASQFEPRFRFGVPYRLITGQGDDRQEASLVPLAGPLFIEEPGEEPAMKMHLGFSRLGYSRTRDQALVYVQYDRLDGGGAGFMVWLTRSGEQWEISDTEVLWAARPVLPGEP